MTEEGERKAWVQVLHEIRFPQLTPATLNAILVFYMTSTSLRIRKNKYQPMERLDLKHLFLKSFCRKCTKNLLNWDPQNQILTSLLRST